MTTELEPIPGAYISKCPDCDAELLGHATLEHHADGSHTVTHDDTLEVDEDDPDVQEQPAVEDDPE